MMTELVLAAGAAFWFGIFTSVNPCPLATNIAAISYIGRRVDSARQVFLAGLLYALGRTLAYLVLAIALLFTALSRHETSLFFQKYMYLILGPILILVGMTLLGLIQFNMGGKGVSEKMQKRVDAMGIWGALLLGFVFALSFCPVSAAIFFGTLITLALEVQSRFIVPVAYGVGTAVPVIAFAVLIALGAQSVGRAYNMLSKVEWWARMTTGGVFLAVGIYFCLKYIFEVI